MSGRNRNKPCSIAPAPVQMLGFAAAMLIAVLLPHPAGAQTEQPDDLSRCNASAAASTEERIAACTAVIEAGQVSLRDLASARYSRGDMYLGRRDLDHALADFNTGVQLAPDYAPSYNGRGRVFGA